MKTKIHPKYVKCIVTCACGESFETRSTLPEMRVEICSKCHPIFTGKQKMLDTEGRVDRFMSKIKTAESIQTNKPATKKVRVKKQKSALDIKQIMKEQEERREAREVEKKKKEAKRMEEDAKTVKVIKPKKDQKDN